MLDTIDTERLTLQALTEADHSFVQELVNTKGWIDFIGDRHVHSKEDAIKYIQKIQSTANLRYWVVYSKEHQISIGIVSFMKRDYLEHFDIGFAFLPLYHSKGYALEATEAVLEHMHQSTAHHTILATVMPANTNSIRLLQKMGFGFQREHTTEVLLHVYAHTSHN